MASVHFVDIAKEGIGNVHRTPSLLVLVNSSGWEEVKTINLDPVSSVACSLFQGDSLCLVSLFSSETLP